MRFLVIILFVLINIQVFPQEERPKDVPDFSRREWIYIKDSYIRDTVTLNFTMTIDFLSPLSDTTQPEIITSTELYDLIAINFKTKIYYFDRYSRGRSENYSSDFEKYIIETYKDTLEYWSRYQSYRELIPTYELFPNKRINFRFSIMLVPEKIKDK